MIYLDTSVVLAHLLAEDRTPPPELWRETLVSNRLLEYEVWVRINARRLGDSHGEHVRGALARVGVLEMVGPVLERALSPFPTAVRTLDALHLASAEFLRSQGVRLQVATYDERLLAGARELDLPVYPLR